MKKKILALYPIGAAAVLVMIGLAAMFSQGIGRPDSQTLSYNQPVYNAPAYPYPQTGNQLIALQAYAGPSRVHGALQVPEIGAEVLSAPAGGLIVTRVYPASHAQRDGLAAGDIIDRFGGQKVTSPETFFRAISAASPEMYMKFGIRRAGKPMVLNVMMGKRELDGVVIPPDAAPVHPFATPG